ncbi:hypothetical protein [Proteiniborus sp. MB09-C3]|uniref:hypothetical protein n=1 Tax=Proteiniborus sp. MB09-C3 TaxID=3050072 RepID=UPI0025547AFA|nr:hypothetical protein [Proteiniborus sp. MB09-C3]WIV11148.1 hypothetical protein QO263_13445 [Proteiniborus sp. MB09-C3]
MNDIKVYKINDYEWWASKLNIEETLDFYLKEYNLDEDDNPIENIKECDIDKEGMWWLTEDIEDLEKLGDNDEIVSYKIVHGRRIRKPEPGNLIRRSREVYKYITFREAIEKNGEYEEPFRIASTDW